MKKFQLEVWNTFDKLCLMSAITKLKTSFADQNWVAISRYTKQLHENISSFIQYDTRSDEWFSAKQCSAQYEVLIKSSGARKKKKVDRNFDYSDVHEALLVSINQEFVEELQLSLGDIRDEYLQTKQLLEELDDDKIDDERLDELINEFLETEKNDIKSKLKSMLDEKNAIESENSKYGSQSLPNEPSTSSEPKATNITTSPLLTSLLQSPSPLVRPSPSTSSPTISLLLHSSPSVSLADPTLSKLLESPTSVPGTSNLSSLETPSFLFQGTPLNSQQSSSETKKKQSDGGEDVSVQRIINDPVEFQRTAEGFDDMSDLEQGVVESEVIIENESSPIKRLTPRRLDLENVGDDEQEEEILETVEEIIERVEEAIIETVGENNLNELVLNEGTETVSISDDEIENINIEDNTYEVIVVGSQEEAISTSNEVSERTVIIDGSISKVDKKMDVDSDPVKNSETIPVDEQIISNATPKSVNSQNVEICNEVSSENEVSNEKSSDEKEKPKPEINIIDKVDKKLSSNLIIEEEKLVENIDAVHGSSLGKQSGDLGTDSSMKAQDNPLAINSIIKPPEQSMPSTLEGNNHSITPESFDEVLIDKQVSEINEVQKPPLSSLPIIQSPEKIMLLENKSNEPKVTKSTEEIAFVLNDSKVKDKYHDDKIKTPVIEIQPEKNEVGNDSSNQILEDNLTKIDHELLEPRGEKEQLELHNEEVSINGLNVDINIKEASKSEEIVIIDSQQSAVMPSLDDEKDLTSTEVVKQNDFVKDSDQQSRVDLGSMESAEVEGSFKDQVVKIDSNSGSSKELVIDNNEIKATAPIVSPNVSGDSKLGMEQHEKINITSKPIESNLVSDFSQSESKQEEVITKNITIIDEKKNKNKVDICDLKQKTFIIDDEKKTNSENIENSISSVGIPEESHKVQEILETEETNEVQETHKIQAQETLESQETREVQESQKVLETEETNEAQETDEVQESLEAQESHDDFCERNSSQTYIESDESKSDSTEETEDNSILTTEDSKDGLDDSFKFSSLETLSMPSVDSPPELNDPKFARLNRKEREFRSLIGKGFEELKSKAAELVFIPDNVFEDKAGSRKQGKAKNKSRIKKDKAFKTKKMAEKTNWEKSSDSKTVKEKPSKDRASNKDRPNNNEKHANSSRRTKYFSSIDSKPDSPSPSTTSSDEDRDYKSWKKSILLVYNRLASHKYASVFSKPITENEAPSYHQLILRPMDLSTIKRNIENGVIRTTVEFQRDMLLMVQNAIIYNKYDTPVYDMAKAMGEDMLAQMEVMVQALGDGVPLIGDTSEEKQITRARTSKSSAETPQSKKRKTQEPDEIRPKRNKLSTPC